MKMRLLAVVVSTGIALTVAAAAVAASNADADNDRLAIAHFANVGHAIPIVAVEKGIISEQVGNATRIETRLFDSGPQVIESLFAGAVDVAYVGPGPAINGFMNSERNNLRILAGAASGGASFVVHPKSHIAGPADFAGKRIAAPQIGNTQDVSLRHYLDENGLLPTERGGSVTIYNIPNPDIYTLFTKGEIDGAWVAEPWATILEADLGGERLFHEEDLWQDGRFASVLLIGNIEYAEKNPQVIEGLLDGHEMAVARINEDPEEARNIFNKFLKETYGQSLADDIVDTALSNITITADPVADSVHVFAERADKLGYLGRNGYDLDGIFYDTSNGQPEVPQ